ncbi:hypothetical protein [Candidatus Nitrosocosmicus arcticus]|uniref:Uncharacterized protein n=1 Tax=Candidatus Nitrosocosmicus arcticus TaxID=2035267 RepID=A0A557SS41_9ARCH|nr:hypothetical protein [Candidatus Nitrosocosmicus arcticus]TVP39433.1 hypothetical protein NARC_150027 [Candidatus Nitrosocosmicus arcticus]
MKKFRRSHGQDIQNHMKNAMNSKTPFVFIIVAAFGAIFFLGSNYSEVTAQPITGINIGNTTSEASDTFFQLDDSIETVKFLVNETRSAISNNNNTEAENLLGQIYNELIQISNNSTNLIWDLSNEGN